MKNKQIRFGAVLSYGTIIFNIAAGLLYTPWLIDAIGDDKYALYTLALSVIHIFMMDFGIGSAVTKFLSNFYAHGEQEEANRFMGIVYKTFIGISSFVAVALILFYFQIDWIYVKFNPEDLRIFKRLFLIVATYSVLSFPFTTFNGVLLANEEFIGLKLCGFLQKVFDVLLICLFIAIGGGVYSLVCVHAFCSLFFMLIKYIIIRKRTSQRANLKVWDKETSKSLFTFSAWYTVMNLARRCVYNIMPTVIAALSGSLAVTLFSLASTLEGYAFNFTDAINGMFMPKVSRIINLEDGPEKLESLMLKVAKFHIFSLGLLFIGFCCIGREFMILWMGEEYEIVYVCTILLLFPNLIDVPQQIARTALIVKDVVKQQAILYVAMAVVNLGLASALIPTYGVVGAAISVSSAYCVKVFVLNCLYRKYLSIHLLSYFRKAYFPWIICGGISLLGGMAIDRYLPIQGWIGLVGKAALIAVLYVILLFTISMDRDMKERIKTIVLRRKK